MKVVFLSGALVLCFFNAQGADQNNVEQFTFNGKEFNRTLCPPFVPEEDWPSKNCAFGVLGIQWMDNLAFGCDFAGRNFTQEPNSSLGCGLRCAQVPGCTHYHWSLHLGGTCWMKNGTVRKEEAYETGDGAHICGVL